MDGTIVTAYYKSKGIWTARAYWQHNGIKAGFAIATSETSAAGAAAKAAEKIMDSFARDGLAIPTQRFDRGRKASALVDNYLF